MLRDDPKATNLALAKALNVNRDTIALDRKILMDTLKANTLTETEQLRIAMVEKLEHLMGELEKHRDDKKRLPVSVIHEMMLVTRSMIELLGVRKPVTEKLQVTKRTISFQTQVVSTTDKTATEPKTFTVTHDQLALGAGEHAE
jgi:hypothetical protein